MAEGLLVSVLGGLATGIGFVLLFMVTFTNQGISGQSNENSTTGRSFNVTIPQDISADLQPNTQQTKIVLDPGAFYGLIGAIAGAILSPIIVYGLQWNRIKGNNSRIRKMIRYELSEYLKTLQQIAVREVDSGCQSISHFASRGR